MRHYDVSDVAVMSRWYLEDYPVYVWKNTYGLLVLGKAQGSEGKYSMELSDDQIMLFLRSTLFFFRVNTVLILALCFVLGWRFLPGSPPYRAGNRGAFSEKRGGFCRKR